jgi:hypothetical protein
MSNELLGVGQERADATPSQGDALVGDLVEAKPRFQCMDCDKSYSTKKSLQVWSCCPWNRICVDLPPASPQQHRQCVQKRTLHSRTGHDTISQTQMGMLSVRQTVRNETFCRCESQGSCCICVLLIPRSAPYRQYMLEGMRRMRCGRKAALRQRHSNRSLPKLRRQRFAMH